LAAAAAADSAGDKILLKGLVFHGYHGVLEEVSNAQ
jgi:dihydroneopterin aldolase